MSKTESNYQEIGKIHQLGKSRSYFEKQKYLFEKLSLKRQFIEVLNSISVNYYLFF
jgi:hypothetical protein